MTIVIGSDRAAAAPAGLHRAHAGHRLPGARLAGQRAVFRAAARRRAMAVVSLWQLQRRDGRLPDRDHAGIDPHLGFRPRL